MSRYHFHRIFKQVTGLTAKQYAAALRGKRMRDQLAYTSSTSSSGACDTAITDAIFAAGYGEAPGIGLDLPLDVRGTALQQRAWQALRDIPAGQTATYAEIAQRIGAPNAVRAVGHACGTNALAVAIPCHRVVRSDGYLSGYRWGVERKRALLKSDALAVLKKEGPA